MNCITCGSPVGDMRTALRWSLCNPCTKERSSRYHQKKREKAKSRREKGLKGFSLKTRLKISSYRRSLGEKRKASLIESLGGKCMDCGFIGPTECFEFDHRNPEEKGANVGHLLKGSLDRLLEEAAKCDLVCANCHAIRSKRLHTQWGLCKIKLSK